MLFEGDGNTAEYPSMHKRKAVSKVQIIICDPAHVMGPDVGKIKNELLVSSYRQMKTEKNKKKLCFYLKK